jgi:hypothetical protein
MVGSGINTEFSVDWDFPLVYLNRRCLLHSVPIRNSSVLM